MFYAEDDEYFVDRESTVSHFEGAARSVDVTTQLCREGSPSRIR